MNPFWVTSWEPLLWWLKACQWCLKPSSHCTNVLLTLIHCSVNTASAMWGHTEYSMSEQSVSQEVHDELFKYTGDDVVPLSVPLCHFRNFKGLETARPVNVWPSSGNTSGTSCIGPYHMETVTYEPYLSTDTDGVATVMFQNRGRSRFQVGVEDIYEWFSNTYSF